MFHLLFRLQALTGEYFGLIASLTSMECLFRHKGLDYLHDSWFLGKLHSTTYSLTISLFTDLGKMGDSTCGPGWSGGPGGGTLPAGSAVSGGATVPV